MKTIFDEHFQDYDLWYEKYEKAYLSELEAVRKALPEQGIGIEVGVGTGRFAAPLGIEVGIDPSLNMLRIARQRGVLAVAARGEALPFRDRQFDYALIAITICFVDDAREVIAETARVLRSGGKIVIAIIDRDSFLGRLYQSKKSKFYKVARFFSVDAVVALLSQAGFASFEFLQTIFNVPDEVGTIQAPEEGYGKGGFVVISGSKSRDRS